MVKVAQLPPEEEEGMKKFFIVGCPRSGTTMVQQALNRHSRIVIPPETKYFFAFVGHSQRCQARHLERLRTDLGIALAPPERRIASTTESRNFFEHLAQLYLRRLDKSRIVYFGEKTPEHAGHLDRIERTFPEARFIFLYRDGRDVALSLSRMPWMSPDLGVCFGVWLYYYRLLTVAKKKGSSNICFVRYEDLVEAPEQEFGRVLDFLGLDFESAVVQGFGNRQGIPARELPWKQRALTPISRDRVGIFCRELSRDQIDILERLGRKALPSLGYSLVNGGNAPLMARHALTMSWNFLRWTYRLPWHCIANEFLGHSVVCDFECRRASHGIPSLSRAHNPHPGLESSSRFPALSPLRV